MLLAGAIRELLHICNCAQHKCPSYDGPDLGGFPTPERGFIRRYTVGYWVDLEGQKQIEKEQCIIYQDFALDPARRQKG
jgi:hypothetical protein